MNEKSDSITQSEDWDMSSSTTTCPFCGSITGTGLACCRTQSVYQQLTRSPTAACDWGIDPRENAALIRMLNHCAEHNEAFVVSPCGTVYWVYKSEQSHDSEYEKGRRDGYRDAQEAIRKALGIDD